MSSLRREYRGLITDFGGVVSTSFDGALRSFCVREGLPPDALERAFSLDGGARGMLPDLERGSVRQTEFASWLSVELGVDPDNLLPRILADLALEPKVVAAVEQLRGSGVRTAVLSNSWGAGAFDPYEPFHLERRFDVVILSHEVKMRKPDRKIFLLAADRLGLRPSECVFVDDVAAYLEPALGLGMGTIHATSPETTVREMWCAFSGRPAER